MAWVNAEYDRIQAEWRTEQVMKDPQAAAWIANGGSATPADIEAANFLIAAARSLDVGERGARDNDFIERWIAAGAPPPSDADIEASRLLLWAANPAAAKPPSDKPLPPPGKGDHDKKPVDPHPTENERKPKVPGKTAEPSQAEKDELDRLLDGIKPKQRKAAEIAEASDEFSAVFGPAIADAWARHARGL